MTLLSSSRYRLVQRIAKGGMGAVYIALQRGAAGFERPVAIKRAHARLLEDEGFRETILREARHASLVRHPNVVSIDDVEEIEGELILVMDYVEGASLSQLTASGPRLPRGVALRIALDACAALDAIHSAKTQKGRPLQLVHRDVSPQNILVGIDGVARITDFGIAKPARDPKRTAATRRRGKLGYMSPEYLATGVTSTSSDMFAMGAVLWESLAGQRLFKGDTDSACIQAMMAAVVPSLTTFDPQLLPAVERVVRRSLARSPLDRFATMREFGEALENAGRGIVASRAEVSAFVVSVVGPVLEERRAELQAARGPSVAPPATGQSTLPTLPIPGGGYEEALDTIPDPRIPTLPPRPILPTLNPPPKGQKAWRAPRRLRRPFRVEA